MTDKKKGDTGTDLESKRLTAFLLGLIVVLSVFFVALEYNGSPSDPYGDDEDLLRALMAEGDAMPVMMHSETVVMPVEQSYDGGEGRIKVVAEESESDDEDTAADDDITGDTLLAFIDSIAAGGDVIAPPPVGLAADDAPLDFRVVEELPQFPGGHGAFVKWLTQNLRYPPIPERQKVQGKVVVTFIVERDGAVSDIRVVQSVYTDLDNEALRVMRMMPAWQAGTHHGEPCRTMVCVPIVFKL